MRTARPVSALLGSGFAASQLLRDARRRGERSTRGFHQAIMPDELRRGRSYLRPRIRRKHAHGCIQVLDDLPGESGARRGEVKMPSRETAGAKFSAGEVSPGLERTMMSIIVGAGKCRDRTNDAIPGSTAYPATSARSALNAGSRAAMSSGRCITAAGVPPKRPRIASKSRSDNGHAWEASAEANLRLPRLKRQR